MPSSGCEEKKETCGCGINSSASQQIWSGGRGPPRTSGLDRHHGVLHSSLPNLTPPQCQNETEKSQIKSPRNLKKSCTCPSQISPLPNAKLKPRNPKKNHREIQKSLALISSQCQNFTEKSKINSEIWSLPNAEMNFCCSLLETFRSELNLARFQFFKSDQNWI